MRKKTHTILAIGMIAALAAAGCQKENRDAEFETATCTVSATTYLVDGEPYTSNEDVPSLLDRLVALAREGHLVTIFHGTNISENTAKEKVVFTTTDPNEAAVWAQAMYDDGYTVTITYDKETGIYTCIAIK